MTRSSATVAAFCVSFFIIASSSDGCKKIENGRYKVEFKTTGFEGYELSVSDVGYTKIAKNGEVKKGKVEWIDDCLLVLIDSIESNEPFNRELEKGLGREAFQVTQKKGKKIYFKIVRTANRNVVISEGMLTRLK